MYVQLSLLGDYDSLTEIGRTYLEQSMGPNWVDRPGNPETILIEGSGQIAAEVIDQASFVPDEAFVAIGTSIYNIPIEGGTRATAGAVISFSADTPAVSVPIDAEVAVPHPSGSEKIFLTNEEVIAPVGGGSVAVDIVALDAGSDYNGAFGASELIEIVEGVESVSVPQATSGGADPETSEDYLDRLTDFLTIPRRPVLPGDHATLALQVPGVGRATAYNLYYPGTTLRDTVPSQAVGNFDLWTPAPAPAAGQAGVPRCTTVAILADGGLAPSPELLQRVFEVLDANREINFLNFVVAPTLSEIDVKCDVKLYTGIDSEDGIENVKATVGDWLSSQSWNAPPGVETGLWELDTKIRLYEAVDYINRAGGVWYCENVQLKLHSSGSWVTGDITMPGLAPIPTTKPENIFVTII